MRALERVAQVVVCARVSGRRPKRRAVAGDRVHRSLLALERVGAKEEGLAVGGGGRRARGGEVSEEPVDTTLKAFVDDAAAHGFEAGEATTHVAAGGNGDGGADGGADGGVRTFVFCRAT